MRRGRGKAVFTGLRGASAAALVAAVMSLSPAAHAQDDDLFFELPELPDEPFVISGAEDDPFDSVQQPGMRLLPENFFDTVPTAGGRRIAVEADEMVYDADRDLVTARGNVLLSHVGYLVIADSAVYDQNTGQLELIGNVSVRDPDGVVYVADRIEVSGDFKDAFLTATSIQTVDGAVITADRAEYRDAMVGIVHNGTYAPCGTCVDANGNTIGWRVHTTYAVLNRETKVLYLERPVLEILGVPIVSLPFFYMPDPTDPRSPGFRFPRTDFSEDFGLKVTLPYLHPIGDDIDVWLTPTLLTRQGFMMQASVTQRFETGAHTVQGAGVYQFDPEAFEGRVGEREWRGAIQTAGRFVPIDQWAVGWSYLAFTDPAFIRNYRLGGYDSIDDVYVTHLSRDAFFDARIQEFRLLGEVSERRQEQQGRTIPSARYEQVFDLERYGRVVVGGQLLGVDRTRDDVRRYSGVEHVLGHEGTKVHATLEAAWTAQYATPGGVLFTPYLGIRGDAAAYDGASARLPEEQTLLTATPIAALDIRYPLLAMDAAGSAHLFEPIAQLAWRGSDETEVGITNDDAHGFVFDDARLFSYDRFSGRDRQETGLRANVGGQYSADFADGSWLRLVAGQSFHLAGLNAYSVTDHAMIGPATGLANDASYLVAGVTGGFNRMLSFGAKAEYDTYAEELARAAAVANLSVEGFTASLGYLYLAERPAIGGNEHHVIRAGVGVPLWDYWTASTAVVYNLRREDWSSFTVGLNYDDGYVASGVNYRASHDITAQDVEHRFTLDFALRGPGE